MILHCVFRHIFVSKKIDTKVWDLACDIAVENLINKLHLKCTECERQIRQIWLLKELEEKLPKLSAEWIYQSFMKENLSDEDIEQLRRNFMADDHSIWYNKAISNQEHGNKTEDNAGEQEEEDTGKNIDQEQDDTDTSLPDGEEGEHADSTEQLLAVIESEDGGGQGGEGEGDRKKNCLKAGGAGAGVERNRTADPDRSGDLFRFLRRRSWGDAAAASPDQQRDL